MVGEARTTLRVRIARVYAVMIGKRQTYDLTTVITGHGLYHGVRWFAISTDALMQRRRAAPIRTRSGLVARTRWATR